MIYTVTLNPALDYVMKADTLRHGDITRARETALTYGGKGINVSVVLTRLGVRNRALGFAAGFTGRELVTMLRADGIDNDFCFLQEGMTRINVKLKTEEELDVNADGPAPAPQELDALMKKLDALQAGDCCVLAGSVPPSLPEDIYETMMARLNGRGVRFAVDATGDLLLRTLKFKPFLIKPNHLELGALFGVRMETEEEIVQYAGRLQERGAVNVLVSRAENGALLLDEHGVVHTSKNAPGTLKNSVGCGDSMVAGFLAGYLKTGDYAEALRLGTACGNATAYSDALATKEEIEAILKAAEN